MAVAGETRVYRNGTWQRRGRGGVTPPSEETFTLGTTEPVGDNSGAGVIRAYPTTVVNGNVTVASGQTVSDKIINGYVDIAVNGTLENCVVRGPATAPTSGARPLVRVNGHTPSVGGPRANIRFCDINPQTPSAFFDGIGYKGYHAYRCKIWDTTDSFAVFSTTADGLVNVLVEGCFSPNMVQWRPDTAYPGGRPHTHNDTIQFQGNSGNENDAIFDGNSLNARFVTYAGTQPLEQPPVQVAAIMITPNTKNPNTGVEHGVSCTIRNNWLRGGQHCVNAGATNEPGCLVVFRNNKFERPGTDPRAPVVALNLSGNKQGYIATGNTYIDNGQPVSAWGV